tara:strand:+ start:174 stop:428 length:255 start_codon:yes stop_codon:yes gene_type:complete
MDALELLARVKELEEKNQKLELQKARNGLKMKVSQKGAVSIYGMGRFPVTLYADQWRRIDEELIKTGSLDEFLAANEGNLTYKE